VGAGYDARVNAEAPAPDLGALPDWSTLFDLLPVGAYRSTPDGRQLRANLALVRMNGYERESQLLDAVQDIAHEWYVDPARRSAFRETLEREGRVTGFVSEVFRHRTRERIWVSENAHLVRDAQGRAVCYEGTVEEITAHVRARQSLERSEAQLRVISERLPGVVYLAHVSPEGTISFRFISEGVRELYGVDPEEAMRDGHVLQRMRHPDDDARVQAGLTASERHERAHSDEFRIIRPDGSVRWVRATSSPIDHDDAGDHRCGLIIDVTARHEAEALRADRDRADAAHRAIASLLARISHELRTPLNAVLGFAQLLEADAALDARQRRYAAESVRAGRHLLALVDDLLDLGRAESGDVTLQLAALDPGTALQESLALVEPLADAAGVRIEPPVSALPRLRADPLRLRQVLTNLLSNAIKYNRAGGWVRIEGEHVGDRCALSVIDNGPGLDAGQQARLFQPFERLGAESGPVAGTGLGLTLSLQLARAMGGDIVVTSRPGQGSRFTLTLPAVA
jgi:PAS domain S-box-containing protein